MRQEEIKLKPLDEQVIVITGASSGIGLATAKMAARRGAKVVISSRNIQDLHHVAQELREGGAQVLAVPADVTVFEDMEGLRDQAMQQFGRIDTWINNAGVSIYGHVLEIPYEEEKLIFETNFWGVRHGCRVAVSALAQNGGAIINIGSEVSEVAVPEQGMYSATKHAVKAYTNTLRMDLEKTHLPIVVTLVRPAGVDTPFTEHARNHLRSGTPSLPSPVYHPDVVARAILHAAEHPKRDVYIGAQSRLYQIMATFFPRTVDYMLEKAMYEKQAMGSETPHLWENEGLSFAPKREGKMRGGHKGHVQRTSLYTEMTLHPVRSLLIAGAGIYFGVRFIKYLAPLAKTLTPAIGAALAPMVAQVASEASKRIPEFKEVRDQVVH